MVNSLPLPVKRFSFLWIPFTSTKLRNNNIKTYMKACKHVNAIGRCVASPWYLLSYGLDWQRYCCTVWGSYAGDSPFYIFLLFAVIAAINSYFIFCVSREEHIQRDQGLMALGQRTLWSLITHIFSKTYVLCIIISFFCFTTRTFVDFQFYIPIWQEFDFFIFFFNFYFG